MRNVSGKCHTGLPGEKFLLMCYIYYILPQIQQNIIDLDDPSLTLKIKLSGDGAKMSRLTNFVVVSFAVLNTEADIMS